jgi:S-adenosylmethionine uptake transporter
MNPSSIVIGSEAALALYPILIKAVPTGLTTQLLARFLTFTVLAAVLAKPKALTDTWGTPAGAIRSGGLGLLTLSHVAFSYYAFQQLPAGIAMSIFYTYPLWNLLGGVAGLGERISSWQLALVALGFAGTVLVSLESREGEGRPVRWKGVLAALGAAVTETGMYFAVRGAPAPDPYYSMLELYPGALLGLLAALGLSRGGLEQIDTRGKVWGPMLLFNSIIGFAGYALRFYAIPKLPTVAFSLLSFVGVVASFVWGWLFVGETASWKTLLGAGMISLSSGLAAASS